MINMKGKLQMTKTNTTQERIAIIEARIEKLEKLLGNKDEKHFVDKFHESSWKERVRLYRDERVI